MGVDFEFEQEAENEDDDDAVYDELEDEADVDSEEYRKEMDCALDNVRKLAAKHKEAFVNEVCGAFKDLNGSEPSVSELSSIFSAIKAEFAEETRQEFWMILKKRVRKKRRNRKKLSMLIREWL